MVGGLDGVVVKKKADYFIFPVSCCVRYTYGREHTYGRKMEKWRDTGGLDFGCMWDRPGMD